MVSLVILAALVAAVTLIGAFAIWRMEVSRKAATAVKGVHGTVASKRVSAEHAELSAQLAASGPRIIVAPESHVLTIDAAGDLQEIVVNVSTFNSYDVGDAFP